MEWTYRGRIIFDASLFIFSSYVLFVYTRTLVQTTAMKTIRFLTVPIIGLLIFRADQATLQKSRGLVAVKEIKPQKIDPNPFSDAPERWETQHREWGEAVQQDIRICRKCGCPVFSRTVTGTSTKNLIEENACFDFCCTPEAKDKLSSIDAKGGFTLPRFASDLLLDGAWVGQ